MKSSHFVFRTMALGCLLGAATLMHPSIAEAAGRPVPQATASEKAAAQKAYLAAMKHYEAKRFDEALAGFRDSYGIVASPNAHMMVVNTLVDLKRAVEAYEEAQSVAIEADALGDSYAGAAKAARDVMAELKAQIGLITVTIAKDAKPIALQVGGKTIPEARWSEPIPVATGQVEVSLQTAQGSERRTITVTEGGSESVALGAPKPPPAPALAKTEEPSKGGLDPVRLAGLAAAGVGVIGIVSFNILGAVNNAKFGDLEDLCTNNVCPPEANDDIASGRGMQTAANVMLALGIVGAAAGTGLLTYSFTRQETDATGKENVSVTLSPSAVVLQGRF